MRIYFTVLAGVLGLAFGSFLNVCLSRWPAGESVARPRSHCRACGRTLAWWENVPLLSWLALRGRCRTCGVWIGWRYPLVELAVGGLWSVIAWRICRATSSFGGINIHLFENHHELAGALGAAILVWMLVALAALDAEHLWLPDRITLPGIVGGFLFSVGRARLVYGMPSADIGPAPFAPNWLKTLISISVAAGIVLAIRWLYWLVRRREGIGLGDAKLMAMLGAWLGLEGALLAFVLGILMGAAVGLVVLARGARAGAKNPALAKLPLGTFLCIGGIVSSLWGQPILAAYMRWAGLQ